MDRSVRDAPPGADAPRPPYPPQLILVVDDNRDAAEALGALLELDGNEVHLAHDGEAALAAAEELRPGVILLDIGLPRLDGFEVARRLRATEWGASALLLALTGWSHPEERQRSVDAGFDEHVVKPVDIEALTELLARRVRPR